MARRKPTAHANRLLGLLPVAIRIFLSWSSISSLSLLTNTRPFPASLASPV